MTGERFAHTVAETEAWLDEVRRAAGFEHERQAYAALRAVLHAVRDRTPVPDSARFAAQLPTLLRGLYFDSWRPGEIVGQPPFLAAVRDRLSGHPDVAADAAAHAVLSVVVSRLGQNAVEALRLPSPKDLLPTRNRDA